MSIMTFMRLLIVTPAALAALARNTPSHLQTRQFTGPSCLSNITWTNNEENVSSCEVAANVFGSCGGTVYQVTVLDKDNHYNPPAGNAVNQCSCSWAAYNLLMACTICQGVPQSVYTWPEYITNCTGQTSTKTYFPTGFVLPNDTGIPFYAGIDPMSWPDERFDSQKAQGIVDQGHHDLFPSSQQQKSSRPVGAIVGGVIGGLAVIALAVVLAFCLYRKRQKRLRSSGTGTDESKHARKMSDLSQKSGIGYGYQQLDRSFATSPTSQPPLSPTTGTMHTHTASANSLSYFGSVRHSVNPYGTSTSPPPATQPLPSAGMLSSSHPPNTNTQGLGREGIIVPFTLPPSDMTSLQGSSTNLSDRKRADGAIIPVYDPPNSLPYNVAPALSETSTTRARVNPPAYSAVDEASIAPTRTHEKKDSNDTQFSTDSKTGPTVQKHIAAGGGSISTTIEEVIGQMGISGQESVSAGGTLSTGQSGQLPGARPFVPVLGNPDP